MMRTRCEGETKRELPSMFQANPSGEAEFAAGIYFEHTIAIFVVGPVQLISLKLQLEFVIILPFKHLEHNTSNH